MLNIQETILAACSSIVLFVLNKNTEHKMYVTMLIQVVKKPKIKYISISRYFLIKITIIFKKVGGNSSSKVVMLIKKP